MSLKKFLIIKQKINSRFARFGQAVIEYVLLVAIAIITLIVVDFITRSRDGSFSQHFNTVNSYITGGTNLIGGTQN